MIETKYGKFELIKNYRDVFELEAFEARYINLFDKYAYIVGDYSAGLLRLKGFTKNDGKNSFQHIPDYLCESCSPNCGYFILKRNSKKNKKNNRKYYRNNKKPKKD